jgi:hypothetical protein
MMREEGGVDGRRWQFQAKQAEMKRTTRAERERNVAVVNARMAVLAARRDFLQKVRPYCVPAVSL